MDVNIYIERQSGKTNNKITPNRLSTNLIRPILFAYDKLSEDVILSDIFKFIVEVYVQLIRSIG